MTETTQHIADTLSPTTNLEEFAAVDPAAASALRGTSRRFFEPPCPHTSLNPERKAGQNATLQFIPNQPVNRAWDLVFRVVLARTINNKFGLFRNLSYTLTPQAHPDASTHLVVELHTPFSDDEAKRFNGLIGAAADVANVVIPLAAAACEREHEKLARDLGLSRRRIGF